MLTRSLSLAIQGRAHIQASIGPLPPSEIPDGAILTVNGEVIYAVGDGLYVFAVDSLTLLTFLGEPIKSIYNKFIIV